MGLSETATIAFLSLPGASSFSMQASIIAVIVIFAAVIAIAVALRKSIAAKEDKRAENWADANPGTENPSAFMTASMQGVIEKLRAQEKELARLHRLEKERAQESERLSEEVIRNMPTGLLLVNATGAITMANPAAETALGMSGLQYRAYREVLGRDSDLSVMLSSCLREGQTFQRSEVQHSTLAGETRQLGVTISPILRTVRKLSAAASDTLGGREVKVTGALCLMSDLTELTALQKQIRWKENLAALGEMSAGIAHEFKNSLATISGYAQMLRSEAPAGDLGDCAEKILDQTRALTRVVTEFLRFAKPIEISYETVDLRTLVERVTAELREAIPDCSIVAEGDYAEVPGDDALLRQAVHNLVRNAAEAVREIGRDGSVSISATIEDLGGHQWQRIAIADNGPGIATVDLPKIFLPFYTTKSDGTGLGLAVVQKIALQHGGSVEARNREHGGAEFLLWLPLRQEHRPAPLPPSPLASNLSGA